MQRSCPKPTIRQSNKPPPHHNKNNAHKKSIISRPQSSSARAFSITSTPPPAMPPQPSETNPISFSPGQLTHILQPLRKDYQPRFTTSITTTNPEIAQQTEHDNIVSSTYYDPDFDKDQFTLVAQTYALKIPNSKSAQLIPVLQKNDLSATIRFKSVIENVENLAVTNIAAERAALPNTTPLDSAHRRVILRESIFPLEINRPSAYQVGLDHTQQDLFERLPAVIKDIFTQIEDETLAAILPKGMTTPSSFTTTGHIAHFNLRPEQLPYQYVIGRIIADKTNGTKTVINKVGMINNVFRNFQAEVLYGESNFITDMKENGFNFVFDFSQVYWNSRLLTEHNRLTQYIHKGWKSVYTNNDQANYAIDLFGGVGPFVVPLAKAQGKLSTQHTSFFYSPQNTAECFVWGNDINPKSSLYMYKNALKNKILTSQKELRRLFYEASRQQQKDAAQASASASDETKGGAANKKKEKIVVTPKKSSLKVFNSCGRELMQLIAKSQLLNLLAPVEETTPAKPNQVTLPPFFQHAIMNLPGSAVEFLDMFVGLYSDKSLRFVPELESAIESVNTTTNTNPNKPSVTTPTIRYLTSASAIPQEDTAELVKNIDQIQASILPPHFNDEYEALVDNLDINDPRHHWSTIQALQLASQDAATDANKGQKQKSNNNAGAQPPQTVSPHKPIFSEHSTYSSSNTIYIPSISTTKRQLRINTAHTPQLAGMAVDSGFKSNELIVHCYCFVRDAVDPYGEALNLVEGHLGFQLAQNRPAELTPSTNFNPTNFNLASNLPQNDPNPYRSLPVSYSSQLAQLDLTALPPALLNVSPTTSSAAEHSTAPQPLDVLARQKSYIDSPDYAQYKVAEHSFGDRQKFKDKYCSEEGLLLMNWCLQKDHLYVHHVRNVAPQKDMMCVSFVVPDYVLFYSKDYQQYLETLSTAQSDNSLFLDPAAPLSSPFDSTPIDSFDIQLFNQQKYYQKQATYTTFMARKIQTQVLERDQHDQQDQQKKKELTRLFQHAPPSNAVADDGDDDATANGGDVKRQRV